MSPLTWTPTSGAAVTFSPPSYRLRDFSGMDGSPVDIRALRAPYQHGATLVDVRMASRTIRLEVWLIASTDQAMWDLRRALTEAFNPQLGLGTLTVEQPDGTTYAIKAEPEETPRVMSVRGRFAQLAIIELFAPHPLWYDPTPFEFAIDVTDTVFPDNQGSVPAPVTLTFNGPVDTPVAWQLTSGQLQGTITIDRVLTTGERVVVRTGFGSPSAVRIGPTGEQSDVMHWVKVQSIFFPLYRGQNQIVYTSTDEATPDRGQLELEFHHWFVGI